MSAIDWLGEKINDPPDFYAFPREKNGKSEESNIEIKVDQLPGVSKNSIGIHGNFSSNRSFKILVVPLNV